MTTGADPYIYANRELAGISLRELQACPSGDDPEWAVLYKGLRTWVDCGTGSARIRAGNTSMRFDHGYCYLEKRGGAGYHFGTYVADETVSLSDPRHNDKTWFQPLHFWVTLGLTNITPSYEVTPVDGTYTDTPVNNFEKAKHGINVVITGNGKMWDSDFLHHTTTVTLTHGRTRGSFTATTKNGVKISGTFRCGSRIDGSGAPQS
jgi:hypothetical protein